MIDPDFKTTPLENAPLSGSSRLDLIKNFFTPQVLKWLILLALFLLVVSFLSFWFSRPSFSERDVVLTLEAPQQGSVGDEIVYKLKYANNTKLELKDLRFVFFYPPDAIVLKDGKVQNETSENFSIDKLSPGDKGEKEFRAFLGGDRGNIKIAKATMFFKAGTLRSSFEKSSQASTTIVSLPIPLSLVSPPNFVSGQKISYLLDYRNESSADITDLRFEFTYPDGFTPETFEPKPTSGNTVWDIPALARNGGGRITIQGSLSGNEGDNKEISVILYRKLNGEYVPYERAVSSTSISSPLLSLDVSVNEVNGYTATLGDTLRYKIKYKNLSTFTLTGLSLSTKLEGSMYDFTSLQAQGGFFQDSSKTIIWDAGAVSNFGHLTPNAQGEVIFSIRLKKNFPSDFTGSQDFFVKAASRISTSAIPTDLGASEISSVANLTTKITTAPSFSQTGYYKDPSFGSSGPFPPKVGQATIYTIHWELINPGNTIDQAKVTGTLPTGVSFKEIVQTGSGTATFNPNRAEITWDLGNIPAGTGTTSQKYELVFKVSATPSSAQIDQSLILIQNSQLSGIDSFTRQNIVIRAPELKTNGLSDKPGDGTVQP